MQYIIRLQLLQNTYWLHKKKGKGVAPKGTRAVQLKETDLYASTFLDTFGRPNRFSIPERNGKSNLSQALHLLVGSTFNDKLWTKGGHVYERFKGGGSDRQIVELCSLCLLAMCEKSLL